MSESVYAKFFLDTVIYELSAREEKLERRERNVRIDDEDIDLLIVAEKTVYVVEVKVQPKQRDVAPSLLRPSSLHGITLAVQLYRC